MTESEIQRVSKTHELRASHSKRALVVKGELRELKRKGMNTLEVCKKLASTFALLDCNAQDLKVILLFPRRLSQTSSSACKLLAVLVQNICAYHSCDFVFL